MAVKQVRQIKDLGGFGWQSGKVRDRALVDPSLGFILFWTSNRISAFDAVLRNLIPGKGWALNQLSIFWKRRLVHIITHDIVSDDPQVYLPYLGLRLDSEWAGVLERQTVLTRRALVVPVECVARGNIYGSLYDAYQVQRGDKPVPYKVSVFGHKLPGNLQEAEEFHQPIFTPTTKAESGHDVPLDYRGLVDHLEIWLNQHTRIGRLITAERLAQDLQEYSLAIYAVAREYARQRGIIIADTKFEFGFIRDEDGELRLHVVDELLTPDSSRFWGAKRYKIGRHQPSLDKQPVRDWLTASGWNKEPPAPILPRKVVRATTRRYERAYHLLVGAPIH